MVKLKTTKQPVWILYSMIIFLLFTTIHSLLYPGLINDKITETIENIFDISDNTDDFVATVTKLKFTEDMVTQLHTMWDNNIDNEYGLCLNTITKTIYNENKTKYNYSIYVINAIEKTANGNDNYVIIDCKGSDAKLHNHPHFHCDNKLWNGDITGAKQSYQNGNIFFLIQCERDKIEVYTREDMLNGKIISLSENIYNESETR